MVFYFLKQMSRWTICTQSADVMPQYSNLTYSHFFIVIIIIIIIIIV